MNKKLLVKNLLSLAIVMFLILPVFAFVRSASAVIDPGTQEIAQEIQLGSDDPRLIVARIINTAMLFLGIIAVVLILIAGFKWMTAGGNEDKVSEAKKLMGAGIIGLVIILAAWGIAQFVLDKLIVATGNQ
ncbi:MAG: pilin [Candidatus Falkowbacteria bacterium]|nr:pilin [Candidatus Falkowbacteria bacterium]